MSKGWKKFISNPTQALSDTLSEANRAIGNALNPLFGPNGPVAGGADFLEKYGSVEYLTEVGEHWAEILSDPLVYAGRALQNGGTVFVGTTPVAPAGATISSPSGQPPSFTLTSLTVAAGGSSRASKVVMKAVMSDIPQKGFGLAEHHISVSNGRVLDFRQENIPTVEEFFGTTTLQPKADMDRWSNVVAAAARTYYFTLTGMQEGPVTVTIQNSSALGMTTQQLNFSDPPVSFSFTAVTSTLLVAHQNNSSSRIAADNGQAQQDYSMASRFLWKTEPNRPNTPLKVFPATTNYGTCVAGFYNSLAPYYYRGSGGGNGTTGPLVEIMLDSADPKPIFTQRPSVTLSSAMVGQGTTTMHSQVLMKATFSQPVYDFSPSEVTITNGTASDGFTYISPDRTEFSFLVMDMSDLVNSGTVSVSVPENVARNANNPPLYNTATSSAYTFSKAPSPPFVYLTSSDVSNGGVVQGSSVTMKAMLLKPIDTPLIRKVENHPGIPLGAPLKLWLKADSLSLANGAAVPSWTSYSAKEVTATSSRQPTFQNSVLNGKPAIRFSGNKEFVIPYASIVRSGQNDAPNGEDLSIFVVYSRSTATTTNAPIIGRASQASGWASPNYIWGIGAKNNNTNNFPIFNYGSSAGAATTVTSGTAPALNTPTIISLVKKMSTGSVEMYLNGALSGSQSGLTAAPISAQSDIYIGGNQRLNSTDTFNGDIFEIMVYNTALDEGQRKRVEGYLAHKFALTSLLPSDHPNKTTSPALPTYFESRFMGVNNAQIQSLETSSDGLVYTLGLSNFTPGTVKVNAAGLITDPATGVSELLYGEYSFIVPSGDAIFTLASQSVAAAGSPAATLSSSSLSQQSGVSSSVYFANSNNWKRVIVHYRTANNVPFNLPVTSRGQRSRKFKTAVPPGSVFRLNKIIIEGKNGQILSIKRAAVPSAASLDLTVTA